MKPVIKLIGAAALLLCAPIFAQGEEADLYTTPGGYITRDYFGVLGTYTEADKDRSFGLADIDQGIGLDLLYGHMFDQSHFGFEIHGFSDNFETRDSLRTDFYRYGAGADLTLALGDRTGFTFFLLAGGGGTYNDVFPDQDGQGEKRDDYDWFANAGLGFVTAPVTQIGLLRIRGEVRYVYDNYADAYGDIRAGLGVEVPLLKPAALPPAAISTVQVVQVSTGLLDTDGDGVVDEKDRCPGTPLRTRVDGNGCPLSKVIALNGVTFEFDQARLRPDAQTILDDASAILRRYPDMKVEVAGHTDSMGSDSYNQKLSERRAAAVREYFVERGIAPAQMSVRGYGEAEPEVSNETEAGRERNRRVELRILN